MELEILELCELSQFWYFLFIIVDINIVWRSKNRDDSMLTHDLEDLDYFKVGV